MRSDTLCSGPVCLCSSLSLTGSIFLPFGKFSWPVFPDAQQKITSIAVPCVFLQHVGDNVSSFCFGLRNTRVPQEQESGYTWSSLDVNGSSCFPLSWLLQQQETGLSNAFSVVYWNGSVWKGHMFQGLFYWPLKEYLFSHTVRYCERLQSYSPCLQNAQILGRNRLRHNGPSHSLGIFLSSSWHFPDSEEGCVWPPDWVPALEFEWMWEVPLQAWSWQPHHIFPRVVRSWNLSRESRNSYFYGKSHFITLFQPKNEHHAGDTSFCPELGREFLLRTKLGSLWISEHGFLTQLAWMCLRRQEFLCEEVLCVGLQIWPECKGWGNDRESLWVLIWGLQIHFSK